MPIEKRWVVKPQGDRATVEALASRLGMPTVLTNLLVQRGIDTEEKARKFFSPALRDLHDPFLMKDMDKAVERIERAVKAGSRYRWEKASVNGHSQFQNLNMPLASSKKVSNGAEQLCYGSISCLFCNLRRVTN